MFFQPQLHFGTRILAQVESHHPSHIIGTASLQNQVETPLAILTILLEHFSVAFSDEVSQPEHGVPRVPLQFFVCDEEYITLVLQGVATRHVLEIVAVAKLSRQKDVQVVVECAVTKAERAEAVHMMV